MCVFHVCAHVCSFYVYVYVSHELCMFGCSFLRRELCMFGVRFCVGI
jgi:hypothetical protein